MKTNQQIIEIPNSNYGIALEEKASSLTCGLKGTMQENYQWAHFSED